MMNSDRRSGRRRRGNRGDRTDRLYRNAMLVAGVLTALLFIFSLIAMIEFPGAFKPVAWGMVGSAVLFFLLRTVYHYRITFRVEGGQKKRATRN